MPMCLMFAKITVSQIHFPSDVNSFLSLANKRRGEKNYAHLPLAPNYLTKQIFPLSPNAIHL